MKTAVRDDAIAKNERLVRVLTVANLSQSMAIIALLCLSVYSFFAKETVYQPTLMGKSYTLSARSYSPSYLAGIATDVMQLRLTWSPDTIVSRYRRLLSMVSPSDVDGVRKRLNQEMAAVKVRKMRSVFYQDSVKVDVKQQASLVQGHLQRIDDGVMLPPVLKTYRLQFHYIRGTLHLVSITEEKTHGQG